MAAFNFITRQLQTDAIKIILTTEETNLKKRMSKLKIKVPTLVLDDFAGKVKQLVSFYDRESLVILVGLGPKLEITKEKLDHIFSYLRKFIGNLKIERTRQFVLPQDFTTSKEVRLLEELVFQIVKINYSFEKYKSNSDDNDSSNKNNKNKKSSKRKINKNNKSVSSKKTKKETQLVSKKTKAKFLIYVEKDFLKNMDHFRQMAHSLELVRDLGNEPANKLHPLEYVNRVKARGKKSGFHVKVFNASQLKKLGLNSLLSVSAGSQWDGYLIELKLPKGNSKGKKVCLVGKGITFDSGGISLKGPKNMAEMKTDMLGSATVLGVMDYLAQAKSKLNVVGYLAIAENMPDAKATRPGDVVKAYNGKTIEILDTDAEGRLVLADALVYAQKHQKPEIMINYATLTGQQSSISCSLFSSLMTFDKELEKKLLDSGEQVHEKLVSFPIYQEFVEHTESEVADVKNSEFRCRADMIQAGAFLSNFVDDEVKWAHIDIAGPARYQNQISGVGVRLTVDYLETLN